MQFIRNNKVRTCLVIGLAEFFGTSILMYYGCMGTATIPTGEFISIAFAFAVLACMQIFGHISGAHLNPAVTIAALIMGQIELILVPCYIIAHFIGAFTGYGILMLSLNDKLENVCMTLPHPSITEGQAFGIEFMIMAILTFALCSVWDKKNTTIGDSTSLSFTFFLAGIFMVSGPLTGASLNSARSLVPAAFNNNFKSHWIYWTAPNLGAITASLVYKYVFNNFEKMDY